MLDRAVAVLPRQLLHLGLAVGDRRVDLARDEVLGLQRREQARHLLPGLREHLQDQQRRDNA